MQELKFTITDPVESEYVVSLESGDTEKVLEMGDILLFKVGNPSEGGHVIQQLRELHERTGRFIIVLFPGQELQKVELKTREEQHEG